MSVQIFLLLLIVVVTLIYYLVTRNSGYWNKKGVLGPKPTFFFGSFKDIILRRTTINEQFGSYYKDYPNEKVIGLFRMISPMLLVRDLDLIQHIFIKDFDNFVDRGTHEFGTKGISLNLFTARAENWRVLRSRLRPIFSSGKLKNMFHLLDSRGDYFLEHIAPQLMLSPDQDANPLMQKYTILSISACAFGIDIDLNNYEKESYEILDNLLFSTHIIVEISHLFPGLLDYFNIEVFPKQINKFFKNLIETVIKKRNGMPSNRKDFIDLLLDMKNAGDAKGSKKREDEEEWVVKITHDLLSAQAAAFFGGGYETSASTLSFMLHEMALNQDIQDRVVTEINDVLAKHDNKLTYDNLKEMTYLEQIFDEVLRMYPIGDPLTRKAKEAYKLPGTNITLEKDSVCRVSVRGIHYDEKYYPEPYKFDPDRFTPDNVKSRHPCAYMPFGLGPRNCVGMRFAKVQTAVCAVKLLRKYRVEPSKNTPKKFIYDSKRIALKSKNGYPLRFLPRK